MSMRLFHAALLLAGLTASSSALAEAPDPALQAAIASPKRTAAFVARDAARHPAAELAFFGLRPDENVVEIWPFAGYWTEILAPYLHDRGTYTVALEGPLAKEPVFAAKIKADPATYGRMRITDTLPGREIAPAGSADLILTFRNLHNWMKRGEADRYVAAFYRALKPGGILGIEEHRGNRHVAQDPKALDGYVNEDYAIALIEKAGFKLAGRSEVNANPKDTAEWPKGVWTLPPTYALGDKDRARYAAVGEGDNFVLKFRKP